MNYVEDITGKRFGRYTVLKRVENSANRKARWLCRCDCGTEKVVTGYYLRKGRTKSCGCYNRDLITKVGKNNTMHGLSHTRLYVIWNGMVRRCHNPKAQRYESYGGRGITVCDEWLNDFMTFRAWALSHGYHDDLSIDRIDNNKGYNPDNCRWATDSEQANNMSSNTMITFNGKTQNMKQWSIELGISYIALVCRFERGWSVERAFTTPVRQQKRSRG